jgi:hypothetical protein
MKCQFQFVRRSVAICLCCTVAACAGAPIVTATPSSCATLLPSEWKQGVAGAPLPDGDTVADWEVFADAQTGKLDQANGRTKDAIGIVERCEARDAAAIRKATRGFFGRLFG